MSCLATCEDLAVRHFKVQSWMYGVSHRRASRHQKRAAIRSRRPLLASYVAFVPHTVLKGPSRASSAPKQNTLIGFDLLCRDLAVGQSLLECLCICGLFDFPRVAVRELQHRMEILIATCDAALRLTVAAKTCW